MSSVNHPRHYNQGKIECIDIIEMLGLNFALGSALKYIWRADSKGAPIEDLEKAAWYIQREIERRRKADVSPETESKMSLPVQILVLAIMAVAIIKRAIFGPGDWLGESERRADEWRRRQ